MNAEPLLKQQAYMITLQHDLIVMFEQHNRRIVTRNIELDAALKKSERECAELKKKIKALEDGKIFSWLSSFGERIISDKP